MKKNLTKKVGTGALASLVALSSSATALQYLLPSFSDVVKASTIDKETTVTNAEKKDDWKVKSAAGIGNKENIGAQTYVRLKSGSGNGNAEAGKTDAAAVFLHKTLEAGTGTIETTFTQVGSTANTRMGVYFDFVDANNWGYIGYNASGWYYQYLVDGVGSYGSLANLTKPVDNATSNVRIEWTKTNDLTVTLNGTQTQTISKSEFAVLGSKGKGKIGFRAGSWSNGTSLTELQIQKIAVAGTSAPCDVDSFSFLSDAVGQIAENIKVGGVDWLHFTSESKNDNAASAAVLENQSAGTFKNGEIEATILPLNNTGRFTLNFRYKDTGTWAAVGYNATGWYYEFKNAQATPGTPAAGSWSDALHAKPETNKEVKVKVRYKGNFLTIILDGEEIFSGEVAGLDGLEAGSIALRGGTYGTEVTDVLLKDINYTKITQEVVDDVTIESDLLKASLDKTFPRVIGYEYLATGAKFAGQEETIDSFKINGTTIKPSVTLKSEGKDNIVYSFSAKDSATKIDVIGEIKISVKDNDLTYAITKFENKDTATKINTFEIPNLNLLTIKQTQSNTQFKGAVVEGNTEVSGDREITFEKGFTAGNSDGYAYGFLSADGLSAGLWSNSEASNDKRVRRNNGNDTMSLTSASWYMDYGDIAAAKNYAQTPKSELPQLKVCITPDLNKDGKTDWQDGAIAYRDIMNNPKGFEEIKDLVNYRIAMNFASQAQQPFLKTADNIKKVSLSTDGLSQAVMLKGYGNEGHDSAHPDYANIGERMGGAQDFNKLTDIAHKYNSQIGVHINAQEVYPEAKAFSSEFVNDITNPNGWDWLDPAYPINRNFDLGSGARQTRLSDFKKVAPGLDFIYLDVWYGNSWETRKVAKQINDLDWRFSTEFGTTGEYDSTWQHWATDGPYGGKDSKGYNSEVMRFIRNDQRDSFVLNYPSYKGTADNPLLGGVDLAGFEGWQGEASYDEYLIKTYTVNLPTKFLQHYKVTNWESYGAGETSPVGNKEKQIKLKDEKGKEVVVTRNQKQRADNYVERTITLEGVKVLDDVKYLLPWTIEGESEKLYNWDYDGGTTTWELLPAWKQCKSVFVYELSDQGRINKKEIAVIDGKITLDTKAKTAYVIDKGDIAKRTVTSWGEASHVVDPGFNNSDQTHWNISGDKDATSITKPLGNGYLTIKDPKEATKLSQKITGLTIGKDYVAEVYVDNRSDKKASISVNTGSKVVDTFTNKSIVKNYVLADSHQTNAKESYMQVMQVSFTAESSEATLQLGREKGVNTTYFDDIRVVQKSVNNQIDKNVFTQDFESVVQGLFPFVLGSAQGVNDPRTHLSEKSEMSQKEANGGVPGKITDDVLGGNWSIKNHDSSYTGVIYQTIPQNFRFEPGETYKVSFDYQTGLAGGYALATGDGTTYNSDAMSIFKDRVTDTKRFETTVVGSTTGQTWIGIIGTPVTVDKKVANKDYKLGQEDFMLDNLRIEKVETTVDKAVLEGLVTLGKTYKENDYAASDYAKFKKALIKAEVVVKKNSSTQAELEAAYKELNAEMAFLLGSGGAASDASRDLANDQISATTGSQQPQSGNEGPVSFVLDDNPNTHWHTSWSGTAVSNMWVQFELKKPETLDGLRYLPRSGGVNGKITDYEVYVQTSSKADWQKVSMGTFNTMSSWQLAKFDTTIENVTKVKLQVVHSVGDTPDKYASAAELRLTGPTNASVQVDKSFLSAKIDELSVLKEANYTIESWKPFKTAFDTAKAVIANEHATQFDVELALANLNDASIALVAKPNVVDKALLQAKYDEVRKFDEKEYTPASWIGFHRALEEAKRILDDEDAKQAEVNAALTQLIEAQRVLVKVDQPEVVDKSELQALVKQMEAKKEKDYTKASWRVFNKAMHAARTILANDKATNADVLEAINDLSTAASKLVKVENPSEVDKSNLQSLYDILVKRNALDYTSTTWKIFAQAIKEAKLILDNKQATQAEVNAAISKLNNALLQLKKVPSASDGNVSKPNQPNTGDQTTAYGWLLTLILTGGVLVVIRKKDSIRKQK